MIVRRFPLSVVCVVAAVILAVILPLGVAYGGLNIPSETIFSVLLGDDLGAFFSLEPASNPMTKIIIDLRLPRMVLASIVGSIAIYFNGDENLGIFVGLWASALILLTERLAEMQE